MAAFSDEDVCRLDVAVDNAFGVGCVEGVSDFDGQLEQGVVIERAACDGVLESHAVQELHGDEGLRLVFLGQVFVDFVNGADIGMVQGGGGLGLALETGQSLGILGHLVRQEFQGDEAVQLDVLRLIDNAHAAATELFNHSVVRDGLSNHWRKSYVGGAGESTKPGPVPLVVRRYRKWPSCARPGRPRAAVSLVAFGSSLRAWALDGPLRDGLSPRLRFPEFPATCVFRAEPFAWLFLRR